MAKEWLNANHGGYYECGDPESPRCRDRNEPIPLPLRLLGDTGILEIWVWDEQSEDIAIDAKIKALAALFPEAETYAAVKTNWIILPTAPTGQLPIENR